MRNFKCDSSNYQGSFWTKNSKVETGRVSDPIRRSNSKRIGCGSLPIEDLACWANSIISPLLWLKTAHRRTATKGTLSLSLCFGVAARRVVATAGSSLLPLRRKKKKWRTRRRSLFGLGSLWPIAFSPGSNSTVLNPVYFSCFRTTVLLSLYCFGYRSLTCFTREEPMSPRSVFGAREFGFGCTLYDFLIRVLLLMWFGYCVGGVEGEAGEAVRGQRSERDLRVQVQNALRRREIHRFWFDLWYGGKCKEVWAQVSSHQGMHLYQFPFPSLLMPCWFMFSLVYLIFSFLLFNLLQCHRCIFFTV